ncbi:MAG: ribosome recycling factor [Coriobacteriia bacterium]|nr:ribosome recycling factor [Coriobacteriia bacterium]MDR2714987.1 ribosome recycling factor [Coriobacteriales bacterium]
MHHEEQMDKTVANLQHEFMTVRTGRASAAMLERVMVDYYGTPTPITQLAGIKTPEAHLLVVEPWDKGVLKDVEKALLASDLGITPSNDGSIIRLPFPPPTEERRKELVKQCRQLAEEAKVAIRNVRRDANTKLERLIKAEDLSKDEEHRAEEHIQKLTDTHVAKIEENLKTKEAEVMEV